jgi:hypothetical protein
MLAIAVFAMLIALADLTNLKAHLPQLAAFDTSAAAALLYAVRNGSATTRYLGDDSAADAAVFGSGRRRLLQGAPSTLMAKAGVVLKRPNYTLPACALSRKEGPFRPVKGQSASGGGPATPGSVAARAAQRPVRILVVGMQSSGASTFLFLLGQVPGSVAVVDLWVGRPAPTPPELGLSDQVTCVLLKVPQRARARANRDVPSARELDTLKGSAVACLKEPFALLPQAVFEVVNRARALCLGHGEHFGGRADLHRPVPARCVGAVVKTPRAQPQVHLDQVLPRHRGLAGAKVYR